MTTKKLAILSLIAFSAIFTATIALILIHSPSATAQDQPPPAADLSRADVIKLIAVTDFAKLRGVNLQGVDLSRLDLRNADLSYADLTDTDFSQADLQGATFACATIGEYRFNGAIMPNGLPYSPNLDMTQFFAGDCGGQTINTEPDSDSALYITLAQPSDPAEGVTAICGLVPTRQATAFGRTGDTRVDLVTSLQAALDERNISNANLGLNPLIVESVTIEGDYATITIIGDLGLAGVCDDAYVDAQISLTVFLYPDINTAYITLNGTNIRQGLFALSGAELPDVPYTRAEVESQYLPQ